MRVEAHMRSLWVTSGWYVSRYTIFVDFRLFRENRENNA